MQNFVSKVENILEKANEEIEKVKFEFIKSESNEERAKKIEIIAKYYQTILSSSLIFNKEIEEKVKCIYNYSSLNDNSVVYYNPMKNRVIESDDEVTPSFRIKTGKIIERDDEVDSSRILHSNQDYDQVVINIPKNSTVKKNNRVIICDDEVVPSFRIKGRTIESDDEATPSFRIKGRTIEFDDEVTPSFRIKGRTIEIDDEVTPSFNIKRGRTIERDEEVIPSFKIKGRTIESDDEATPSFNIKMGKTIESDDEVTPRFEIKDDNRSEGKKDYFSMFKAKEEKNNNN